MTLRRRGPKLLADTFHWLANVDWRRLDEPTRKTSPYTRRLRIEPLEDRRLLASAAGVENVLLPQFMAQMANVGNQLPASDAWWALRGQRNMAIAEPISKVMNIGAHNAYNALNEGFRIIPLWSPNQILSLTAQFDLGARLIELDIHDPDDILILKHGFGPLDPTRAEPFILGFALDKIKSWLMRPENRNEIIFLDIEDATSRAEVGSTDPLVQKLRHYFEPLIYTPQERTADGAWPSRSELIARNKRVIIFTHRNDEQHGRFGVPELHVDSNGHAWYGASIAFRANGSQDATDRGNFEQVTVEEIGPVPSEDANSFFAMQSDGLVTVGTSKEEPSDVRNAVAKNVDFLKMDFLFGDDEDADLGIDGVFDHFFDIAQGNRVEVLEAAVWSWAKHDPAVDRQMFQDLIPGDGTGAALFNYFVSLVGSSTALDLADIGAQARNNGRDVAIQNGTGRWESLAPTSSTPMRFAARSIYTNSAGEHDWRVTSGASTNWNDGQQFVTAEFGSDFVFAGPLNGFQNWQLLSRLDPSPVWINVHDYDRDGNWKTNDRMLTSHLVVDTALDEDDGN